MPRSESMSVGMVVAALIVVVGVLATLLVLGNLLYWVGDGSPGTPAEFRERVAGTGLVVEWTNNGSRGGDGTVATDCGVRTISVSKFDEDDSLFLFWKEERAELTPASAEAFQTCDLFGE